MYGGGGVGFLRDGPRSSTVLGRTPLIEETKKRSEAESPSGGSHPVRDTPNPTDPTLHRSTPPGDGGWGRAAGVGADLWKV